MRFSVRGGAKEEVETEKEKVLVAQLCPTLCTSVDCRSPGSSVHGIFSQEY